MGGIGQATAIRLAKEGYRLCLLYYTSPKKDVDAFIATLCGGGHIALTCNLAKSEEVHTTIAVAHEKLGRLDTAIHTAVSPLVREKASVINPKQFSQQFEVTTFGGLNFFQATLAYISAQKEGHLIGITTKALDSERFSGMTGYLCAKYALRGLLRELAFELAPHIRVHEIAPGFVSTKLHADLPLAVRTFITERTPTQTPEDIADMVSKLLQA